MEAWSITGKVDGEAKQLKTKEEVDYVELYIAYTSNGNSTYLNSIPLQFYGKNYKKIMKVIKARSSMNGIILNVVGNSQFKYTKNYGLVLTGMYVREFMIYSASDIKFVSGSEFANAKTSLIIHNAYESNEKEEQRKEIKEEENED